MLASADEDEGPEVGAMECAMDDGAGDVMAESAERCAQITVYLWIHAVASFNKNSELAGHSKVSEFPGFRT